MTETLYFFIFSYANLVKLRYHRIYTKQIYQYVEKLCTIRHYEIKEVPNERKKLLFCLQGG